jgi:hypothetical protein
LLKYREQVGCRDGEPDAQGKVDHGFFARDPFGSAGESSQMVARIAVVAFDMCGMGFADDVAFRRQDFGKSIPMVGVINAVFQVFDLVVEAPKGSSITTTEHPGHSSPRATIHGLDDPEVLFFEPIKCNISSNSIS